MHDTGGTMSSSDTSSGVAIAVLVAIIPQVVILLIGLSVI